MIGPVSIHESAISYQEPIKRHSGDRVPIISPPAAFYSFDRGSGASLEMRH